MWSAVLGYLDEDALREQELYGIAVEIAVRVGLLAECELHQDELLDTGEQNHEDAYRLANSLITKGDPLVAPFADNRRQLTDLLRDICDDYGECCGYCARNAAE